MENKTGIERIIERVGFKDIVDVLSKKLSWSDLYTLLLHVMEKKTKLVIPADVMKNHVRNRLSAAAPVCPKELLRLDRVLFDMLPPCFSPTELSPVISAGANTSLTSVSPKVILSTIRNVEVVADPTMALALECAREREPLSKTKDGGEDVHLAASHRTMRLQAFATESGFTAHFRAFALASSGKDRGHNQLELSSLERHLEFMLSFLSIARQIMGYETHNVAVGISNIRIMEKLMADGIIDRAEASRRTQDALFKPFEKYSVSMPGEIPSMNLLSVQNEGLRPHLEYLQIAELRVVQALRKKYPEVRFYFDLERCAGMGYYSDICYKLTAENSKGVTYPLADGGASNWTQRLLQNKKERFFSGGFGSELFCRMFRTNAQSRTVSERLSESISIVEP